MSIQEKRERRNGFMAEAKKLMNETKDIPWTNEHQSKYDSLTGEISALERSIEREQKILDMEAEKVFNVVQRPGESREELGDLLGGKAVDALAPKQIFNTWLRQGEKGFSADQRNAIKNTMSVGTGSQGGFTVQTTVASEIINILKDYSGVRKVATRLPTSQGNPMSFPTTNGTAEVGELVGENTVASGSDPSFGTVSLNTFKYGSKVIAVPIELLQDSNVDVQAIVIQRMIDRIGRITNQHFTSGNGSTQPNGLITAASAGKVGSTGQTLAVIYDDLVDLIDSIDIAYHQSSLKFMFSQASRRVIRKIKDTTGRPIWTPNYDGNITGEFVDTLLGFDVVLNNDMPTMAANAKSIAFGDFSKYWVRDVMDISMFRFDDSAYMQLGQVGFLSWMRAGGNLLDTTAVKYYQNSAT